MSLANKYRPIVFDEMLGNEENIEILKGLLKKENPPHTYLFHGDRGCGKTTLARILCDNLNIDKNNIMEVNGSNNRGIETARQIIEQSRFKSLDGNNKAFILDEIHKATKDFQNALLKVLEEPPSHVYFILATTEPNKLIKTILSRCSKFEVEKIDTTELMRYLIQISEKEKIKINRKICRNIAKTSEGHVRDALKILEKIMEVKDEEKQLKISIQKLNEEEEVINLCRNLLKPNNWQEVRKILKNIDEDLEKIRYAVLGYMGSVLLNEKSNVNVSTTAGYIIECFSEPFYNTGKPGLVYACFCVFSG